MAEKVYNKLVRDGIPRIIVESGRRCAVSVLSEQEYILRLEEKLREELEEYLESKSMEELADLLEVMRAVAAARGHSWDEVERLRSAKAAERGAFADRVLLERVWDGEK